MGKASVEKEMKNFSRNVKRMREESGLSKMELAAMLQISRKTIANIENGIFCPYLHLDVIVHMADIFHVNAPALFLDDGLSLDEEPT